jgi:hypothetical protein
MPIRASTRASVNLTAAPFLDTEGVSIDFPEARRVDQSL